jgi:hypothetical protein
MTFDEWWETCPESEIKPQSLANALKEIAYSAWYAACELSL